MAATSIGRGRGGCQQEIHVLDATHARLQLLRTLLSRHLLFLDESIERRRHIGLHTDLVESHQKLYRVPNLVIDGVQLLLQHAC